LDLAMVVGVRSVLCVLGGRGEGKMRWEDERIAASSLFKRARSKAGSGWSQPLHREGT